MTKRIAIIGGGIAGNAILHHVVNHPKFDDSFRIDIFDSKERMGRGKPYIEDSEVLLLNIPSDEMSMTNAPYNFVEWLESKIYLSIITIHESILVIIQKKCSDVLQECIPVYI